MNNIGLYIHVPFCRRKCSYCDFYSLSGIEELTDKYTDAVVRNLKGCGHSFDTVYFGGGTPSLLTGRQIHRILSAADICSNAEISAECNPDSASPEKLADFFRAGINRISLGIQSLDDRELKLLGRLHDSTKALTAVENARKVGFENISADLMLGIPYQNEDVILNNIKSLAAVGVDHISAYMLKIESGTPLSAQTELISACADDDTAADYYELAISAMSEFGYAQYEISNFAQKGYECRHNLKYWRCQDYLGVGPSAHSCINGVRSAVPTDIYGFMADEKQKQEITDDNACTEKEKIMLGLRLSEGIDVSGMAMEKQLLCKAISFTSSGLVSVNGNTISLTPKGFLVSNEIICRLIF